MAETAIVLRVGDARYALSMTAVAEVARVPPVTRVPGAPDWVAGVANWRGRILAVVDLRRVLGAPAGAAAGRLVVAGRDGVSVGLLADDVAGLLQLPEAGALPAPPAGLGGAGALLAGTVVDGAGPVGLIDMAALFALRRGLARAAAG